MIQHYTSTIPTYKGRFVGTFNNYRKGDGSKVGGKISSLGELLAAEVPGSPGFALEVEGHTYFLDHNPDLRYFMAAELENMDSADEAEAMVHSERIRHAIMAASLPDVIVREISDGYKLLGPGAVVAVRSSATAEDLPDNAFAGQQDTVLGVRGVQNICAAILKCYASLFNYRAYLYRRENGIDHLSVGISVGVQKLVKAARAGVMFTIDTVSGDRSVANIEVIYGLGELFVQGEVTGDMFVVSKTSGEIIARRHTAQDVMMVLNDSMDATILDQVPEYLQESQKLSDQLVAELTRWGTQIEEHYGVPMDVEFAVDEEDNIFILQARPVTTNKIQMDEEQEPVETAPLLSDDGLGASPGVAYGRIVIINGHDECHLVQEGDIMVTEFTTPDYMPAILRCAAMITERGGKNCHTGVTGRELGKPAVVNVPNARKRLVTGQMVTTDGSHAKIFEGEAHEVLAWGVRRRERRVQLQAQIGDFKTATKVGVIVGDPTKAEEAAESGADYVPLLRFEQAIAHGGEHPMSYVKRGAEGEYISLIEGAVLAYATAFAPKGGDVWSRFNDQKGNEAKNLIGAAEFVDLECENPMLHIRGGDLFERYPDMLRLECEAIRRVIFEHGYDNVVPMFPFVRTVPQLRHLLEMCYQFGLPKGKVRFAMMVELPTNVILLEDYIAQGLWGVSLGTNDLTQLVLGADRDGGTAMDRYDERDPAVQWCINQTITRGRAAGAVVSLCGNMFANYPETIPSALDAGIHGVGVYAHQLPATRLHIINWETANPEIVARNHGH